LRPRRRLPSGKAVAAFQGRFGPEGEWRRVRLPREWRFDLRCLKESEAGAALRGTGETGAPVLAFK
jgi:hypothetical protein